MVGATRVYAGVGIGGTLTMVGRYPSTLPGTPLRQTAHDRRVYTEHASVAFTAVEHGVAERYISGLLIYRPGVTDVAVRHRCCLSPLMSERHACAP